MALRILALLSGIIAGLVGWACLAISIAAISVINWLNNGVKYFGLFTICDDVDTGCYGVPYVDHWLHTVRAFIIMMIVFGGLGCLNNVAAFGNKKAKSIAGSATSLFLLAGLTGVIGMAVFTGTKEFGSIGYSLNDANYGASAILGWIAAWSYFFAGLFQGIAACTAPNYEVH